MTNEVTAREELHEIAAMLREADESEKEWKKAKEELRSPFFQLISEVVRDEVPLATQHVEVEMDEDFDPETWRAREYPEWRIIAIQPKADGTALITIEENEDFKKFEFVHDGFKFGRTIRMEGKNFDVEGFYNEVDSSVCSGEDEIGNALLDCVTVKTVKVYEFDEAKAQEVMADHPETVVLFQKYLHPGTPKPTLLPIKPVKDQE